MAETRRIENYGVLKFLPEERGANNLIVQIDVIQLPYSEYLNVKSNPPKSHYGYVCFMSGEYVLSMLDIQFRRQIIVNRDRYLVQLAWQEFCNSKTILEAVANTSPDTTVDYPIWLCDELRFKLEPGVILNVFKSHIPPTTCPGTGISEPNLGGTPPGLPPSPSPPPPPSTPEEDKLSLSPPYEGDDDNGNTYVRPEAPPDSPPDTGQAIPYLVTITGEAKRNVGAPNESTVNNEFTATLQGPLQFELRLNRPNAFGNCDSSVDVRGGSDVNNAAPITFHDCGTAKYTYTAVPA